MFLKENITGNITNDPECLIICFVIIKRLHDKLNCFGVYRVDSKDGASNHRSDNVIIKFQHF